jgi:hypothetical protein
MQMRLANRVINARDPALEDRIVVFDRVRMHIAAEARILVGAVVDGVMCREPFADLRIIPKALWPDSYGIPPFCIF